LDTLLPFDTYLTLAAPITRLYIGWFNRLPDLDGLHYWIRLHRDGMSIDAIATEFANAMQSETAELSDEAFIQRVYDRLLLREADEVGAAFYAAELASARTTRPKLMLTFAQSDEVIAQLKPRVVVSAAYTGLLGRAGSAAEIEKAVSRWLAGDNEDTIIADIVLAESEHDAA
jgi:Domain of unknown function (DUF4214)